MIKLDAYTIERIAIGDAEGVHHLMTSNTERFRRFFPKTLEQNLSVELAQIFVLKKVKEFDTKEEFLYTIKTRCAFK